MGEVSRSSQENPQKQLMSQLPILLPSGFIDRKMIYFRLLITVTKPFVDDLAPAANISKGEP